MSVSFWYGGVCLVLAACSFLHGAPASAVYRIRTIAGNDFNGDGRPAPAAILVQPEAIAFDAQGTIYIADPADNRVRKVDASGRISTLVGTGYGSLQGDGGPASLAGVSAPYDVCLDRLGNVYVADLGNARIRRITRDGIITTIAGGGALPPDAVTGRPATSVQLVQPRNIAVDATGVLYISDFGAHRIFQVTPDGNLRVFAGVGEAGTSEEGVPAIRAKLSGPAGLAVDGGGNVYVADSGNGRVMRISGGYMTTVRDVGGRVVAFPTPTSIAVDRAGELYVADVGNSVTRITPGGAPVLLPVAAKAVAMDPLGRLFIVAGRQVQRFDNPGIAILAGSGLGGFSGDGRPASEWRFQAPSAVVRDLSGTIHIADSGNGRIRQITARGDLTTLISGLGRPVAMAFDSAGRLYVADAATGIIHQYDRGNLRLFSSGSASQPFVRPSALAFDTSGNLLVADTGNNLIRKISPGGFVTTIAGGGGVVESTQPLRARLAAPAGLTIDPAGNVWFTEAGSGLLRKLNQAGELTAFNIDLKEPRGIKSDAEGNLYICDGGARRIIRSSPDGKWWPIAGGGETSVSDTETPALETAMLAPVDLWLDSDGRNILVADAGNGRISELRALEQATAPPQALTAIELTVLHAATLQPQNTAPGQLVLIRGKDLTDEGHTLAVETEITIDGAQAALLRIGRNEIVAQLPLTLRPGVLELKLSHRGVERARAALTVVPRAPGLFTAGGGGGQVLAINEHGTTNSVEDPASRGSVISLYGTGHGSGGFDASVYINGFGAEVLYAGPAPGQPGIFQINARTPAGFAPSGVQSLIVEVNGIRTQTGVTIVTR